MKVKDSKAAATTTNLSRNSQWKNGTKLQAHKTMGISIQSKKSNVKQKGIRSKTSAVRAHFP